MVDLAHKKRASIETLNLSYIFSLTILVE